MTAKEMLDHGNRFPFDAPDAWWQGHTKEFPPAKDWSHAAARGVLADLKDRRGMIWGLSNIDEEVREEIVDSLAEIIREASAAR
jgi:hypothetical protein